MENVERHTAGNQYSITFRCPLANGFHARPASQLAALTGRFASSFLLINERTRACVNAKSVLAIITASIQHDDSCELQISGTDAVEADPILRRFIEQELPKGDDQLPPLTDAPNRPWPRLLRQEPLEWLSGRGVSGGVGRGIAVISTAAKLWYEPGMDEPAAAVSMELEKIHHALARVRQALAQQLQKSSGGVVAGILQVHLAMVEDHALHERLTLEIEAGRSSGQAIRAVIEHFSHSLKNAESAYFRERITDLEDIGGQLLSAIYGRPKTIQEITLSAPAVVVAENLTLRQFLSLDRRFLRGLVLEHSGTTGHVVILARAHAVPTVVGVAHARMLLLPEREIVVEANLGRVIHAITPAVQRYCELEESKQQQYQQRLLRQAQQRAITCDGRSIEISANISKAEEMTEAIEHKADGVGLFRTEMLFLNRESQPSEEEQFAAYRQVVQAAAGRPVIIRTLDVGGDKPLPYLAIPPEANPFLGCRGVRLYPEFRELFMTQLRAILRASAGSNIWLMVPMITLCEEISWVRERINDTLKDFQQQGIAYNPVLPLGIMVEIPSAALSIAQLATEVDFFSIGTNDLAQYFFAVDRDSATVGTLGGVRHPAFLKLLRDITRTARRHGKWVGLCGEMADRKEHLPLLLGLGLDEISISPAQIPAMKSMVRRWSQSECRQLLKRALACRTAVEVEELLKNVHRNVQALPLLEPELLRLESTSCSREEVIKELADLLYINERCDEPLLVEEALWTREEVFSTGLGYGFAVPHCKSAAVKVNSLGLVRLQQAVSWPSVDDQPVDSVLLLALNDREGAEHHLKIFARLARKLMHEEFRRQLRSANNNESLCRYLMEELEITIPPDRNE
ncbi:MAG: Multiphosphoryl transfer protein 1 [Phycisphaerae bacterium]|nr:Multiphosphoryl transfer protein 1 [Phycisphaerae bacterium]